jgi:hypothetical protein
MIKARRRPEMRSDDLMKPDVFSELLLIAIGASMALFLLVTLWLAVFRG